jgi:acetoin utilization protein AcuB
MTAFPHCVQSDDNLGVAERMMVDHEVRHLPVMERGRLVGVLSDRNIRQARACASAGVVGDVCDRDAYVVSLSEPLDRVLMTMAEKHYGSALVVKEGRLAGIFTTTDACRHFGKLLRTLFPSGGDEVA